MRSGKKECIYSISLSLILCLSLIYPSYVYGAERQYPQFRKQPEVQQIKPAKPVRIKLHRNNKGEYSWDITGDNVDEIIRADRKLKRLLKNE